MTDTFKVIIPARYASTRLPGKPLLLIGGKHLLQHVYESACASKADQVIIATDDQRILDAAAGFGAETVMTAATHTSGTERIAEVIIRLNDPDDNIIVNLQGDEIGMPPALINQTAEILQKYHSARMSTLYERISNRDDIDDPNVVKVVVGKNNTALYFSRAAIPWNHSGKVQDYFRHIGLYAYRAAFLRELRQMSPCDIEKAESLEQLRVLYHGVEIYIEEACTAPGIGIDTEDDLERARQYFSSKN